MIIHQVETIDRPCVVCGVDVTMAADAPSFVDPLCMEHFFTRDVTKEWESDEEDS